MENLNTANATPRPPTLAWPPADSLHLDGTRQAMNPQSAPARLTAPPPDRLELPPSTWRRLLPPDAYAVLFEEATERAGTSPLNHEKRAGTFVCAACHLPLFRSSAKYESGTGWPSFFEPLPDEELVGWE